MKNVGLCCSAGATLPEGTAKLALKIYLKLAWFASGIRKN
jgi:hypothetical protein